MTRVSTFGNYQSALLDLMSAQTRSAEAQNRVSSQKVAQDLIGFGRTSESVTALKSSLSRIQGYIDTGKAVAERLTTQDTALNRVADGVQDARQAIADALAAGRFDGLMLELQGQFQIIQDGLNTRHQGRYLFGGGQTDTLPVTTMTMSELAAAPDVDSVFNDGTLKQVSRLDEGVSIETGFLASEIGSDVLEIFRDIQLFHQTTPITGASTDAVADFLTAQLSRLDAARSDVTDMAARNGSIQNRVDSMIASQETQVTTLESLLSNKTDADMAQALTDLQFSQVAIQATAQVISQLRETSLLNLLQ